MSAINNLHPQAEKLFELLWECSSHLQEFVDRYSYANVSKIEIRDYFFALYQSAEPEVDEIVTPQGPYLAALIAEKDEWREYRSYCRLSPVEAALGALAVAETRVIYRSEIASSINSRQPIDTNGPITVLRSKIESVEEQAKTIDEIVEGAGGGGGADDETGDIDLRSDLEARFAVAMAVGSASRSLLKIADEIGRHERLRQDVLGEKFEGSDEIEDVTVGADIPNLLPSEFAKDPTLFAVDFTERKLMQYEKTTAEKEGLGPIYILADKSGSMAAPIKSDLARDDWTVSIALAITKIAKEQDRDVVFQPFHTYCLPEQRIVFKKGRYTIDQVCELLGPFALGGTCFVPALHQAEKALSESGLEKADILVISDGEFELREREESIRLAEKIREKHNARIFFFNVDGDSPTARSVSDKDCYFPHAEKAKNVDSAMSEMFKKLDDRRQHFLLG